MVVMPGTRPAMTPSYCLLECIETANLQWDLQYLARVHDAERVGHRLDGTHQLDDDLVFRARQFLALELANAVLGGDRSAHPPHDVEYHRIDLVPAVHEIRGVAANGLADIIMDIAVAEMAERHRPRARNQ